MIEDVTDFINRYNIVVNIDVCVLFYRIVIPNREFVATQQGMVAAVFAFGNLTVRLLLLFWFSIVSMRKKLDYLLLLFKLLTWLSQTHLMILL